MIDRGPLCGQAGEGEGVHYSHEAIASLTLVADCAPKENLAGREEAMVKAKRKRERKKEQLEFVINRQRSLSQGGLKQRKIRSAGAGTSRVPGSLQSD